MSTNQITNVYLLSVPLENDYKHTLFFPNLYSQQTYFLSKRKQNAMALDCSYQRKDHYIRFPKHIDELEGCNYVMYQNPMHTDRWYYAFITKMEYKNDGVTWVYIETDVLQTYMKDYTVKPSFVEREHVDDDTEGLHTVPENLETGDPIVVNTLKSGVGGSPNNLYLVMGVTETIDIEDITEPEVGGLVTGMYSGITYLAVPLDRSTFIDGLIDIYDERGKSEAIQCLFLAPEFLINKHETEENNPYVQYTATPALEFGTLSKSQYMNGTMTYKPRNNKLNCYPYKFLHVSNNSGASAVYHYEDFEDDEMTFQIMGVLTPGCSIRLTPKNYKGVEFNEEEGLNLGKFPICNWTSDVYINWLTQNSVNIGLNIASGIGQIVGGVAASATGGGLLVGIGESASGVSAITNQLAQIHQMSITPPQSHGNINCGDVVTIGNNNCFFYYFKSIKEEYLKILDGYFDMFGYKSNMVKVPNVNHRENYWFTKTIDVSIDGAIPMEDMQKIKNCYNNGITFWKNPENIGDYSVSNSITV